MKASLLKYSLLILFCAALPAGAQELYSLPFEDYAALTDTEKKGYDRENREAFFEFESAINEKMEISFSPFQILNLLPEAFAAGERMCLMGGARIAMVPGPDRYLCPSRGRPCGGHADGGFKCDGIYNDACITREPISSISSRCNQAAGDASTSEDRYNARRAVIQSVAADCKSGAIDDRFKSQCARYLQRIVKLNDAPEAPSKIGANPGARAEYTSLPPADIPKKSPPAVAESGGKIVQSTLPPPRESVGTTLPPARPRPMRTQTPPRRPVASAPPASAKREKVSGDCMSRNQAKVGALACVACGMENASPAEVRNQGGVSKWVALVGAMAQTYYGPYNVEDGRSRAAFQQRVAEMVSSYGYCTDSEFPATPGNDTRDYIDGRKPLRGGDALRFSQNFGMMSTVNGWFSGKPENQGSPLEYAEKMFNDSNSRYGWESGNVQNRQNRFRSMAGAFRHSYKGAAFAKCANAIENRLANSRHFKMCPIREGAFAGGGTRTLYASHIAPEEMAGNQKFYETMASSCGLPKARKQPHTLCDNNCWGNDNVFRHAVSARHKCDQGGTETYAQFIEKTPNPGKPGEPSNPRSNRGKPGEPSVGRGTYGGNHGGGDNGGGGGEGSSGRGGESPSGASSGGGGGKGGEGGGTSR